jgi:hypothetical protein
VTPVLAVATRPLATVITTYPLMSWLLGEAMKRGGNHADTTQKNITLTSDYIQNSNIDSNKKIDLIEAKKMPPTLAVSHLNIDSENYMLRSCEVRPRSSSFTNGTRSTSINGNSYVHNSVNFKGSMSPLDLDMFSIREKAAESATMCSSLAYKQPASLLPPLSLAQIQAQQAPTVSKNIRQDCDSIYKATSSSISSSSSPASELHLLNLRPFVENKDSSSSCAQTISLHQLLGQCSCRLTCCCMCIAFPDCQACFHTICMAYSGIHPCKGNKEIVTPTLNKEKVCIIIIIHRFSSCPAFTKYLQQDTTAARFIVA